MVPEPLEELMRADRKISRLVFRLRQAGVPVEFVLGSEIRVEGDIRDDGEPV